MGNRLGERDDMPLRRGGIARDENGVEKKAKEKARRKREGVDGGALCESRKKVSVPSTHFTEDERSRGVAARPSRPAG